MLWRFLTRGRWWQAHPFSLSAAPDGRSLRLTVKAVGTSQKGQKGLTMNRTISTLLATTMAAVPFSTTWAATHAPARPTIVRPAAKAKPTHKKAAPTRKIVGPVEDMQWGPVQVTIVVKSKKITDVQATAPMERARSQFINSQAIPWLRQEVLKAQSANIDAISGATLTSYAFYYSLQGALKTAHKDHVL